MLYQDILMLKHVLCIDSVCSSYIFHSNVHNLAKIIRLPKCYFTVL